MTTAASALSDASGRNDPSSSAASSQCVNSSRLIASVSMNAAPSFRCAAARTWRPASSSLRSTHAPQPCNASRSASSQPAKLSERESRSRAIAASASRHNAAAESVNAAMSTEVTADHPLRRSVNSSICKADDASAPRGQAASHDLSQSSQSSQLARGRAARNAPATNAPARVVDNFQPVSSSTLTCRRDNSARTRRTSKRSCAISATGAWPALSCAST